MAKPVRMGGWAWMMPFIVACGEGAVCVVSAKPEGKREMPGFELVNGHYVKIGDVFSAGNSC